MKVDDIKKPNIQTDEYYDYYECSNYIEYKYNIKLDDLANSHAQFYEWCDEKGYGEIDPNGKERGSSQIWFAEFNDEVYSGIIKERPYRNFWHKLFDTIYFENGDIIKLTNNLFEAGSWMDDIVTLFIKEFGDAKYKVDW